MTDAVQGEEIAEQMVEARKRLMAQVGQRIIGQEAVVEQLLIALLARGHILLTGLPGLGKTSLVRAIAECLSLSFKRVQFTPDLMPADILGTEVVEEDPVSGKRLFRYIKGPVFANVLLADEINRTPPKTQAALLEAMGEGQVTAAGETHTLPKPFFVLATQNPIELEGTYPLPEAQLDRFLFNIIMQYLPLADEIRMVSETTASEPGDLQPVFTRDTLETLQGHVREVPAASPVVEYVVRLVAATRPGSGLTPKVLEAQIQWGAGSRASQALVLGGKVRALLNGRYNVAMEDVRALAPAVLRHRIIPSFQAEAEGVSTDAIIEQLLERIKP